MPLMPRMCALSVGALLLVAGPATTQVTSVPFINGFSVNGSPLGGMSCGTVNVLSAPVMPPLVFSVSCRQPNDIVIIANSVCLCSPCSGQLAPSPCAIPFSACFCSNQAVDINLAPPCAVTFILLFAVPDGIGHGVASTTVPFPAAGPGLGFVLSTQAAILDSGCASPSLQFVLTKAYNVFRI